MEDLISAHPDINVILAESDVMGVPASKVYFEQTGKRILAASAADGRKMALEAIMNDEYDAMGTNFPQDIGIKAVEAVEKYFMGEKLPLFYYTPSILVTKENAKDLYDPDALF
jgi:ribose transport system substrate-binding protein